jgi:2'-hydroxyisoflavone reductase
MLSAHVKRYIFVSAVSVYGDPQDLPVLESHPRIAPAGQDVAEIDAQTYGPLKVACEDVVQHAYGDRCTLLRPQIVVGPLDQRGRYAYWVQRAMQAGEMLAPGDGSDHLQVIDVRDVGRFARTVIERDDLSGAFNLAGPRLPWAEFMKLLGARNIVWVSAEIIKAAGVTESELPLFRPERGARSGLMDVSNHRARSAGLVLTDPQVTMRDMRAWILEHTTGSTLANTLSPEREAELIRMSRTVQNPSGRVGN